MTDQLPPDAWTPSATNAEATSPSTTGRILLLITAVFLVIDLYLLLGVVPKFMAMFDSLKGELPGMTVWILAMSSTIQQWFLPLLAVSGIGGWFAFRHAHRIPVVVHVVLMVAAIGTMLSVPLAIFYPILQLQSAIRGDQPASQPVEPVGAPR